MPFIFLIILGVALIIATYRDILTREVPDTLSYGLIVVGLLGGLIVALTTADLAFFLERVYGFLLGMAIGFAMYYGRQWGGGDAKLMMGIGAIFGFNLSNFRIAEFLIFLVLAGAVYGLAFTLYLALIKHRRQFLPAFKADLRTPAVHRLRIGLVATGVLCIILLIFVPWELKILVGFFLLALYFLVYSWIFVKAVERTILVKEYPISKLTEGDWIVGDVKARKRVVLKQRGTGITLDDIKLLKQAKVKKVTVKEGIPFVPGFMLAFIALIILEHYGLSIIKIIW